MKIGKLYALSLLIGYLSFVICGMTLMYFNNGIDYSLWKGILLLVIAGITYLPVFGISNLTQFLLVKKPYRKRIVFLSSILITGIISIAGIKMNVMDAFLWEILIPAQLIVSTIVFYYYQPNIET